mmetsp:Transcript_27892/g.41510  ORF Transcript_27892/g.41510 Transcript_27892/m.41510 type:complete len:133 (-) Transcript_27892:3058-3456(-)
MLDLIPRQSIFKIQIRGVSFINKETIQGSTPSRIRICPLQKRSGQKTVNFSELKKYEAISPLNVQTCYYSKNKHTNYDKYYGPMSTYTIGNSNKTCELKYNKLFLSGSSGGAVVALSWAYCSGGILREYSLV